MNSRKHRQEAQYLRAPHCPESLDGTKGIHAEPGDLSDKIREAYDRRKQNIPADRYSRFKPDTLLRIQELERESLNLLARKSFSDLTDTKILEVGCGDGTWLRFLLQAGASPENLFGVDLLPDRIENARKKCPTLMTLLCEDASRMSFADASFDLILVMTVFSSVLDSDVRRVLAREMIRVLKANGGILWYDFHLNNPANPDVVGIGKDEIKRLFPNRDAELCRITLAPPIGRIVARAPALYWLLSNVPFLRSHYLGWIGPK